MKTNLLSNMKFHTRLILSYILACIIPLFIASSIIYNSSVKNLEDASQEFASIFNSQIVSNIDNFIDGYDKITKSVLVDNDIITRINNESESDIIDLVNNQLIIQKMMLRLETLTPEIMCIMLLSAQNKMYQYSDSSSSVNSERLTQQSWFFDILKSKNILEITPIHDKTYYDDQSDSAVITIGRVLFNSFGEYSGILLIDLDPNSLIKLNNDFLMARNNYNMRITVTDSSNYLLYDSDAASGKIAWSSLVNERFNPVPGENVNDYILMQNKADQGNLTVNTLVPKRNLLFKIGKINYITFFSVLVCILIVIGTSLLFSKTITKPIDLLQEKMKSAEEGQYLTMEQTDSNDEISSLISSYNTMISKIKSLIEDVYIAQLKQQDAKFLSLQMQINPHMLYNTLESIRMKALVNGDDDAAKMIKILARMFKLSLGKSPEQNLIRHEIEYAEHYITLQNIRFNDSFLLEVDMEEEIKDSPVIALILQPLIENSINHGFQDYNTVLRIGIAGYRDDDGDILLQIYDNGAGIPDFKVSEINKNLELANSDNRKPFSSTDKSDENIGLQNIAERIKLHYGNNYYLRILYSGKSGTVIEIKIPCMNTKLGV